MELFETHFHLPTDVSDDSYYELALEQHVKYFMAVGADYEQSRQSQLYAQRYDNVWYTAGAHPHEAKDYYDSIAMFDEFDDEKLKAIGEIGLDYFYEHSDRKLQRTVFEKFLEYSLKRELPVVVHCRDKDDTDDAYQDCYSMLNDYVKDGGRFEVHCYTGPEAWLKKLLDLGAYIGITGIVTFPRAQNVRSLLQSIPDDRLLIETDAPYLAPVPHRGKTNCSAYLIDVARRIADERGTSLESFAAQTTANAKTFFSV